MAIIIINFIISCVVEFCPQRESDVLQLESDYGSVGPGD